MPMPIKIYNTFRSRWCGAYLQSNGVKVIPTLAWGGPETFWFCFDGVEKKSVVAVSTLGVRSEKDLFIERIKKEIAAITDYSATIKKRKAELKESVDLIEQIIQEGAISDANSSSPRKIKSSTSKSTSMPNSIVTKIAMMQRVI